MPVNNCEIAERYLLISQNLLSLAKAGEFTELGPLFDARSGLLDQVKPENLNDESRKLFRLAAGVEAEFQAVLGGEANHLKALLCSQFQETKAVTGYLTSENTDLGDGSIAC